MTRKRCRACRRRFLPERPIDRYCNACWATRQAGLAPGWLHRARPRHRPTRSMTPLPATTCGSGDDATAPSAAARTGATCVPGGHDVLLLAVLQRRDASEPTRTSPGAHDPGRRRGRSPGDSGRTTRSASGTSDADQPMTLPAPTAPMHVARVLVKDSFTGTNGQLTLHHWRGGWWEWRGPKWQEVEQRVVARHRLRLHRGRGVRGRDAAGHGQAPVGPEPEQDRQPARSACGDRCCCRRRCRGRCPPGLDNRDYDGLIVSVANGLLDVGRRELLHHDPQFFRRPPSVPFDFDASARTPEKWQRFLADLWSDDEESRRVLAEWFGYVISGRLDLHKIMLIVGPTRAGKGVISAHPRQAGAAPRTSPAQRCRACPATSAWRRCSARPWRSSRTHG